MDVNATIRRLEALLPELEYYRETHRQWRDAPQASRDANPDIGDSAFHDNCVDTYDERMAAIREAIAALRHFAPA